MTYADFADSDSRTPVTLVKLRLDGCANVYGNAPCTASGAPGSQCYNTWTSCQSKNDYVKTDKVISICSLGQLPFAGPRPYLKRIRFNPTEIKADKTGTGKVTIEAVDEPDSDIGIDPYVDDRSSVQGSFWKKLLARNASTKGRAVEIYEGFVGLPEAQFEKRWFGEIDSIELGKGKVSIKCVDLLASLKDIEIPPKPASKTVSALGAADAEIILTNLDNLAAAGELRLEDELISYTGTVPAQNKLTGCTRGAGGTSAASHAAGTKVEAARYIPPTNPFDLLQSFLTADAGIDAARVDAAAFTYWRDWPEVDLNISTWLTKPTKLSDLFWEIVDLLDLNVWQNEAQLISVARNLPNEPGRAYAASISDADGILHNSANADLDASFIKTRIVLYWDPVALSDREKETDYLGIDAAVNLDLENVNSLNDELEEKIFCRWLSLDYLQEEVVDQYLKCLLRRRLMGRQQARAELAFSVELKDGGIRTGDPIRISTDELCTADGQPLDREIFTVFRRDPQGARINLKAWRRQDHNLCFIAPAAAPDYSGAAEADKEYGYVTADNGLMPDNSRGYSIY